MPTGTAARIETTAPASLELMKSCILSAVDIRRAQVVIAIELRRGRRGYWRGTPIEQRPSTRPPRRTLMAGAVTDPFTTPLGRISSSLRA